MKHIKLFENFDDSRPILNSGKICVVKINAYEIEEEQDVTHNTVAKASSLVEAFDLVLESMSEYYGMYISPNLSSAIKSCASGSNPENSFTNIIEEWWEEENSYDFNSVEVMITDANSITPDEIKAINTIRKIQYEPIIRDESPEVFVETFINPPIPEVITNNIMQYAEGDSIIQFIEKMI